MTNFYNDLNTNTENNSAATTKAIFDKYFNDQGKEYLILDKTNNPNYDVELSDKNSAIKINEILKMYFTSIKKAYDKYQDNETLLATMAKTLINPQKFFCMNIIMIKMIYLIT